MAIQWDTLEAVFVSLASGSVGGGIVGAIVANHLAKKRDAENRRYLAIASSEQRRRDFIRLAGAWRTKAARCVDPHELLQDFEGYAQDVGGAYNAVMDAILESNRAEFHRLCDELISMNDQEIETEEGHAEFLTRIEKIIALGQT